MEKYDPLVLWFLVQMVNDVSGAVEALETAIAVEPTSVVSDLSFLRLSLSFV